MKTLAILCLAGIWLACFGQTNSPIKNIRPEPHPAQPAPVALVTNYVTAAENFRRVNGQLYNIYNSRLWEPLDLEFLSQTNGIVVARRIKYTPVFEVIHHRSRPDSLVGSGNFLGSDPRGGGYKGWDEKLLVRTDREEQGEIAIKNFTDAMADGEEFKLLAIKTGTVKVGDKTLELWDRGTVNRVPVVTRKQ
jgi:hypothetical protein